MQDNTFSLCNECYGIVPAILERREDGVFLVKECTAHGIQSKIIDPSLEFFDWLQAAPRDMAPLRYGMTALNTTNRCNVRCPGCYALPDQSADRGLNGLVAEASKIKKHVAGLMGAEPTMRDDLPELIREIKFTSRKATFLYTNGIKLENISYTESLVKAGLDKVAISLHLPNYIGEKAHNSKIQALENLKSFPVELDHLSFSLRNLAEVDDALEAIMSLDYSNISKSYVRLRAPSAIGGKRNSPCHMSDLVKAVLESCVRKELPVSFMNFTHHVYAIMLKIRDRIIVLVRWPTVEEIDLVEANKGVVSALFVPEIGETNILHHVLMTERVRTGGSLPPLPPQDCPSEISGIYA